MLMLRDTVHYDAMFEYFQDIQLPLHKSFNNHLRVIEDNDIIPEFNFIFNESGATNFAFTFPMTGYRISEDIGCIKKWFEPGNSTLLGL